MDGEERRESLFNGIFQQGVEEEEEEEEENERTDNTYIRPSNRLEVPGPKQSLVMQTLLTNYRPIQQGWLAKKVTIMSQSLTDNSKLCTAGVRSG